MSVFELSYKGIGRLLNGQEAIVQIIKQTSFERQGVKVYQCTVSDGYSKLKGCFFHQKFFPENEERLFSVVLIKLKINEENRKKIQEDKLDFFGVDSTLIIYDFLKWIIGRPIWHKQFIQNRQINPNGSSEIFPENNRQDESIEAIEESTAATMKNSKLSQKAQKPSEKAQKPSEKAQKPSEKAQKPSEKGPIHKMPEKRKYIKPQVKNHSNYFKEINELFHGIGEFKLLARLLFVWPIKTIISKKGQQLQLLNLEFGDRSGTIICACFDKLARYYSTTLALDKIYEISYVETYENTYRGITQLKLTINQGSRLTPVDQGDVPEIDCYCRSLKQLMEMQTGTVCNAICLLKESQLVEFVSKKEQPLKKKILHLFDLEHMLRAELTLFNERAMEKYEKGLYALRGIEVDEYDGNKQFKSSFNFMPRLLENHRYKNYLQTIDEGEFTKVFGQKTRKSTITSFSQLKEKCEGLKEKQTLWSEVSCKVGRFLSGKLTYLSCPHCKKKVPEQQDSKCQECNKFYEKAINNYLFGVNLLENHDNLQVVAFNEVVQQMMSTQDEEKFPADSFVQLNGEQAQERIRLLRLKKIKVRIVSALKQFQGNSRLQHKITKIIQINYEEENKSLLEDRKGTMNRF